MGERLKVGLNLLSVCFDNGFFFFFKGGKVQDLAQGPHTTERLMRLSPNILCRVDTVNAFHSHNQRATVSEKYIHPL